MRTPSWSSTPPVRTLSVVLTSRAKFEFFELQQNSESTRYLHPFKFGIHPSHQFPNHYGMSNLWVSILTWWFGKTFSRCVRQSSLTAAVDGFRRVYASTGHTLSTSIIVSTLSSLLTPFLDHQTLSIVILSKSEALPVRQANNNGVAGHVGWFKELVFLFLSAKALSGNFLEWFWC